MKLFGAVILGLIISNASYAENPSYLNLTGIYQTTREVDLANGKKALYCLKIEGTIGE